MQISGTQNAFETMLRERGIFKKLGVDSSTVSNWKTYLREGRSISLDKMEEMLIKSGATVVQEKVWDVTFEATKILQENMIAFHDQLDKTKIGDDLTVDYSKNLSEILVDNALNRHAKLINAKVARNDDRRPIVTYIFTK